MVFTSCAIHENVAILRGLELTLTCSPQKQFGHLGATDSLLDTTAAIIDKNNASCCTLHNGIFVPVGRRVWSDGRTLNLGLDGQEEVFIHPF